MGEMDILKKLDTVQAPPAFEQQVMARLSLRKRRERRRRSALRWSLAGSAASLAAVVILLNTVVFRDRGPSDLAVREGASRPSASFIRQAAVERSIPIIETLDYMTEIRRPSSEPETIYLLEQVSDTTSRETKY